MRRKRSLARSEHRHALHLNRMAGGERKPFLLRLPPDLWKELEKWAADELRSVNGQMEYLLREAVAKRKSSAKKPDDS